MSKHGIGYTVSLLKRKRMVTRLGWNGKGMFLMYDTGCRMYYDYNGQQGNLLPHIVIRTVSGDCIPWLCSQADLLADDWQEVR